MPETPQQYTQRIIAHTESKEPLQVQQTTPKKLSTIIRKLNKKQLTRRPAPGKWSIAEILAHQRGDGGFGYDPIFELPSGWRGFRWSMTAMWPEVSRLNLIELAPRLRSLLPS